MANDKYDCPMCHGKGKITWRIFHDENAPQRIIAYGVVAIGILVGSAILYNATTPRMPTEMEQCAASCGVGHMKQYAELVPAWTEVTKGQDVPNIPHSPVAGKCECVTPGYPMTPPEPAK